MHFMVRRELDLEGKLVGNGAAIYIMGGECAGTIAVDDIGIMGISGLSIKETEDQHRIAEKIIFENGVRKGDGLFLDNLMGVADNFEDQLKIIEKSNVSDGIVCAALPHKSLLKRLNPKRRTFEKIAMFKLGKVEGNTVDFIHRYFDGAVLEGSGCGGHIMRELSDFTSTQKLYKTFRNFEKQKGYEPIPLILCNVNDSNIMEITELRNRLKDRKVTLGKGNIFYITKEGWASNEWKKRQIFNDYYVSDKRIKDCEKYGMNIHESVLFISPVGHYYGRVRYNKFIDTFFNYDPELKAYRVDQNLYYDLVGGVGITCDTQNCMSKACLRDICINYALKNAAQGTQYPLKDGLEDIYIIDFNSVDSLNFMNYIKDMAGVVMNEELDPKRLEQLSVDNVIKYVKGKPLKTFFDGF